MQKERAYHFINGEYTSDSSEKTFENRRPTDNTLISGVSEANKPNVDAAVRAARCRHWSVVHAGERDFMFTSNDCVNEE